MASAGPGTNPARLARIAPGPALPLALLIAGSATIGLSSIVVAVAATPPTVTGFYRMAMGGAVLLGLSLVWGRWGIRRPAGGSAAWAPIAPPGRSWAGMTPRQLRWAMAAGLFISLDLIAWHRSIHLIGPGLATLVISLQVFLLALVGAARYREPLRPAFVAAILVAFTGVAMTVADAVANGDGGESMGAGLGLALFATMAYAGFVVALREGLSSGCAAAPMPVMAAVCLTSAGVMGAAGLAEGVSFAIADATTWGALLVYGLLIQVGGWLLISMSLPRVGVAVGGLALLLEPAVSFILDVAFLGRETGVVGFAGAGVALVAIGLGSVLARGRPAPVPEAAE